MSHFRTLFLILTFATIQILFLEQLYSTQRDKSELKTITHRTTSARPVAYTIIHGNPLRIHVGEDMSFQVFHSGLPGQGQIYPTTSSETGDMGILVRDDSLFAPDFRSHPLTATFNLVNYIPWGTRSGWRTLSALSGNGSQSNPYIVTVDIYDNLTALHVLVEVSYIDGKDYFGLSMKFTNKNFEGGGKSINVFLAGDYFLAGLDEGLPYQSGTIVGGEDCNNQRYRTALIPETPSQRYFAGLYGTMWQEIATGHLSNTATQVCTDNGAALEWQDLWIPAAGTRTLNTQITFGYYCPPETSISPDTASIARWLIPPTNGYPNIQGITSTKANAVPREVWFTEYDGSIIGKLTTPEKIVSCNSAVGVLIENDLRPLAEGYPPFPTPFKITYAEKPFRIGKYNFNVWFTDPELYSIRTLVENKPKRGKTFLYSYFTYQSPFYVKPWDIQWHNDKEFKGELWVSSSPQSPDNRIFAFKPSISSSLSGRIFILPEGGGYVQAFHVENSMVWIAAKGDTADYIYRMPVSGSYADRWTIAHDTFSFTAIRPLYKTKPTRQSSMPYQVWAARMGQGPMTILAFQPTSNVDALDTVCYQSDLFLESNGLFSSPGNKSSILADRMIVTEGPFDEGKISFNKSKPSQLMQRERVSIQKTDGELLGVKDTLVNVRKTIIPTCEQVNLNLQGSCCVQEQWKTPTFASVFPFYSAMLDIDMVGNQQTKASQGTRITKNTLAFHMSREHPWESYIVRMATMVSARPSSTLPINPSEFESDVDNTVEEFVLYDAYPNPFNPVTFIHYQLPQHAYVMLKVFNMLGQEVTTLADGLEEAGNKSVEWDASSLPSGVYFYRLTAAPVAGGGETFTDVKKMLLAK
ncbi:MAG: T9SS type A sorting domain-containing protein [Ignavibacteriae bacterium]|nr:T9SS type A sorting domain-containing protein [Ignavibacteriota bacterium]